MNEAQLIDRLTPFLAPKATQDDAYYDSVLRQIYTTDLLVEGNHFSLAFSRLDDVGWKVAAVNLSDIAAMGGQPQYLLVSIGIPPGEASPEAIESLYKGLHQAAQSHGAMIIGGDTVSAPQWVINVTAIGILPEGHTLGQRTQAKPGDWVAITGYSGLSAIGLWAFQQNEPDFLLSKIAHQRPIPQVEAGLALSKTMNRYALMDTSDGLADAVLKISEASQVHIELEAACLPFHSDIRDYSRRSGQSPLEVMLYGGEDFQLLTTVPPNTMLPEPWTVIGTVYDRTYRPVDIDAESIAWIKNGAGECLALDGRKTYQHFP